jgi:hypothetical protein
MADENNQIPAKKRGIFFTIAPALHTASDTARIAFAPSFVYARHHQMKSVRTVQDASQV